MALLAKLVFFLKRNKALFHFTSATMVHKMITVRHFSLSNKQGKIDNNSDHCYYSSEGSTTHPLVMQDMSQDTGRVFTCFMLYLIMGSLFPPLMYKIT